jgi:hypothetical protein
MDTEQQGNILDLTPDLPSRLSYRLAIERNDRIILSKNSSITYEDTKDVDHVCVAYFKRHPNEAIGNVQRDQILNYTFLLVGSNAFHVTTTVLFIVYFIPVVMDGTIEHVSYLEVWRAFLAFLFCSLAMFLPIVWYRSCIPNQRTLWKTVVGNLLFYVFLVALTYVVIKIAPLKNKD